MINAADGGIIQDHVISQALPDIDNHQNKRPIFRAVVPVDRLCSKSRQKGVVDIAITGAQECKCQIADDNHGNQIRDQDYGLVQLLGFFAADFVENNSYRNSQYSPQYNKHQIVEQGVPDHDEGIVCTEQKFKIFKSAPRTAIDAVSGIILPESDLDTEHGNVAVDKQIDNAGHEHQIKGPETLHRFSDFLHIHSSIVDLILCKEEAGWELPIPAFLLLHDSYKCLF